MRDSNQGLCNLEQLAECANQKYHHIKRLDCQDRFEVMLEHDDTSTAEDSWDSNVKDTGTYSVDESKNGQRNRDSGVEVVSLSVLPIISAGTCLSMTASRTFCDDSTLPRDEVGTNSTGATAPHQEDASEQHTEADSKCRDDCTEGGVEVAIASEKQPLYKKLLSYVPTPRGPKRSDLKVFIEGDCDEFNDFMFPPNDENVQGLDARDDCETAMGAKEVREGTATPSGKRNELDPVERSSVSCEEHPDPVELYDPSPTDLRQPEPTTPTLLDIPTRSPTFTQRSRSMPVRRSEMPYYPDIQCKVTFDGHRVLKEQFEATIDSTESMGKQVKPRKWKMQSVGFGIGNNSKGVAQVRNSKGGVEEVKTPKGVGELKSIMKKTPPPSPQAGDTSTGKSPKTSSQLMEATALSTGSILGWKRRPKLRTRSIIRPYTDPNHKQGGIELVKHAMGRYPSNLKNVTFDDEVVLPAKQDERKEPARAFNQARLKKWMSPRPSKCEIIPEEGSHEGVDEPELKNLVERSTPSKVDDPGNSKSIDVNTRSQSMLNAWSPKSCFEPLKETQSMIDVPYNSNDMEDEILKPTARKVFNFDFESEISILEGSGQSENAHNKFPRPSTPHPPPLSTKESGAEATADKSVKPLPVPLPLSPSRSGKHVPTPLPSPASQKPNHSMKLPIPFGMRRSWSARKQQTDLAERKPSHGLGGGVGGGQDENMNESTADSLPSNDKDLQSLIQESVELCRVLTEVAKCRQKQNQSLREAVEELEVELLEASFAKDRGERRAKFYQIREKTKRILAEKAKSQSQLQSNILVSSNMNN